MKRPFDDVTDTYNENLERVRENQLRNFENSEKFMLWIVGFAIGGLSLIFSNLATLHDHYSCLVVKIVLVALAISVVSGIVYRWAFYIYQIQYQDIEFFLKGAFSNKRMMSTDRENLSHETDFKYMVFKLEYDFGFDWKHTLETYENGDAVAKNFLMNEVKMMYNNMSEMAANDYEFAMKYVADVHKEAFGLSDSAFEKIKNKNTSSLLNIYRKITIAGFFTSCLSFIFVIVLLTVLY